MFFFLEIFFFVSLDWKAPEWFEATLARLLDTTTRWAFHSLQPHTQRNVPFDLRAIQLSRGNGVFYHHRQPKTLRVPLPLGLQVLGFVLLTRRSFHWSQEIRNVQGKNKKGIILPTTSNMTFAMYAPGTKMWLFYKSPWLILYFLGILCLYCETPCYKDSKVRLQIVSKCPVLKGDAVGSFYKIGCLYRGRVVQSISYRVSFMLLRHFINSKRFGSFSVELKRGHCQGCTQRLYGESQGNHNDIISRKRCRTWFSLSLDLG